MPLNILRVRLLTKNSALISNVNEGTMRVRIEPREEGEDDEENRCVDQEGLPSRRCFLFHLFKPRNGNSLKAEAERPYST